MRQKVIIESDDEIKWLMLESDENDTGGFFIYHHIAENNAFDTWHKTIEDAYNAAYEQYGVSKEKWQILTNE
ncbi:MAG: hypothetical protein ACK4S0_01840 [Sediminibacterium sp.]